MDDAYQALDEMKAALIDEAGRVAAAHGGDVYPFDLLTLGVLSRAVALIAGFCTLMREGNYLAAATLVRPQLDTLLRYHAGWLVADPHAFAVEVLRGARIDRMESATGEQMQDRWLREQLRRELPWIDAVYQETSGLIHLSDKHLTGIITGVGDGTVSWAVTAQAEHVPEAIRREAAECFWAISGEILRRACGWRETKEHPPDPQEV